MDFWTSTRVTFYGATECLRLDHTYPAEVELHISWCQSILESLKSLRLLNSPDAENLDNWFGIFEGILQQLQLIADTITREEVNANNLGFELEVEVQNVATGGRSWKNIDLNAVVSLMCFGY